MGFILAACEKAVQNVYERKLRPAERQYNPWTERITNQLLAACKEWNTLLEAHPISNGADQVMVSSTVVWTFIQSMIPHIVEAGDFNKIKSVAESFEAQATFKKFPVDYCRAPLCLGEGESAFIDQFARQGRAPGNEGYSVLEGVCFECLSEELVHILF